MKGGADAGALGSFYVFWFRDGDPVVSVQGEQAARKVGFGRKLWAWRRRALG